MHALIGLPGGEDAGIAHAASAAGVPVVGWDDTDDELVDRSNQNTYVRMPRIASSPGILIAKLLENYNYTKIFVMSSVNEPTIASQLREQMGAGVEIMEHSPRARSKGGCSGQRQCIEDLSEAWLRLRAMDARIIVHEHGGSSEEFIPLLSATDLLGPKTLYIQSGSRCRKVDFLEALSWGHAQYRIMDNFNLSCQICPNIGVYGLSGAELQNFTYVAEWLYGSSNPYQAYQASWCPQFPTLESLKACTYCDSTPSHFASPGCGDLLSQYERTMARSFCIEPDLSVDTINKDEIMQSVRCADLNSTACKDYVPSGQYVSNKLVSLGMPPSYLNEFLPGGSQ